MDIDSLSLGGNTAIMFDSDFRNVLEMHLPLLRSSPNAKFVAVEPAVAYRFESNFSGLLDHLGIPYEYRWLLTRINGFDTHLDSGSDVRTVLIPDMAVVEMIINQYNATSA